MGESKVILPEVSISLTGADLPVANTAHKVLLVAQMVTGSATEGILEENIPNGGEEDALFGKRSQAAQMIF